MTKQMDLFAEPKSIDNIIQKTTDKETKLNTHINFGITGVTLNKLSYRTLDLIFYGLHNFNCPKLYQHMNPAEILGLLAGVGYKMDDYLSMLAKKDLKTTISEKVNEGYMSGRKEKKGEKQLYEIANEEEKNEKNIFSTTPGSLLIRIDSLDLELKREIESQFFKKKRVSNRECSYLHDFNDPNIDGHSKRAYAQEILSYTAYAYRQSQTRSPRT